MYVKEFCKYFLKLIFHCTGCEFQKYTHALYRAIVLKCLGNRNTTFASALLAGYRLELMWASRAEVNVVLRLSRHFNTIARYMY